MVESGALMDGIISPTKGALRDPFPFHHPGVTAERKSPGKGPSPDTDCAGLLILVFPISGLREMNVCYL